MMEITERPRRIAAQALARHGRSIKIYDSWTLAGECKTSNGMNLATRPYSPADVWPPLSRFQNPQLRLGWLTAQLDLNMKSICEAPQIKPSSHFDSYGSERLQGSITLGGFGPNMLLATLRSRRALPSAVTAQLRGDARHGLVPNNTDARLVAFLGSLPDLRRDLGDLYRFMRYPKWVKAALAEARQSRIALEPSKGKGVPRFDYAGMPHSPEARTYAELWRLNTPGLTRAQSYARPVLKAYL